MVPPFKKPFDICIAVAEVPSSLGGWGHGCMIQSISVFVFFCRWKTILSADGHARTGKNFKSNGLFLEIR